MHVAHIAKVKTCIVKFISTQLLILGFSGRSNQSGEIFYIAGRYVFFTYNKLCLIFNFLCSIVQDVTSHSPVMQQTGTVLDILKLPTQCVSSG